MEALATALIIIFCTPFGWMGIFMLGLTIAMICKAKKEE
jgi:formate-dependent nitrite reductase membrane component NrfD